MVKKLKVELDNKSLEKIVTFAQEEKKPFEILKVEFGVSENPRLLLERKNR